MKIIGLIEEHSNRNKFSQPYKEFRKGIFNSSKLQILDYLNQGVLFATTMQVVSSLEALSLASNELTTCIVVANKTP